MSKMHELYEKVSKDIALQEKFKAIMKDAETLGEEAMNETYLAFAKSAGYDITIEEMQAFFKDLVEKEHGELSDAELDLVAGGKTHGDVLSWISLGIGCAITSAINEVLHGGGGCAKELGREYDGSF